MAKYRMGDIAVDTTKARRSWMSTKMVDGDYSWITEHLHESAKGHYYLERTSEDPDYRARVTGMTLEEAVAWLIVDGQELPEDLQAIGEQVSE